MTIEHFREYRQIGLAKLIEVFSSILVEKYIAVTLGDYIFAPYIIVYMTINPIEGAFADGSIFQRI